MTIGLIGGASGKDLTDELHKKGYQTAIAAGKEDEPGMDTADYALAEDLSRKGDMLAFFRQHEVRHVLLGTGHILAFQAAEYLEAHGIQSSVNVRASLAAKDKGTFKRQMNEWGILTPRGLVATDDTAENVRRVIEEIGLPCVVKSCIDKLYPQKASTEAELRAALTEVVSVEDRALCETFIDGVDVTIAVISDGSRIEPCVVNYYSKANEVRLKGFGTFRQHRVSEEGERAVRETVRTLTERAGFLGLPRFDCMVTEDNRVYVFECNSVGVTGKNPRYQAYADQFLSGDGINYAELLVRTALTRWGLPAGAEES